ncbi:hypothetical protein [Nocardia sp. NPDC005366]|uniref:hypothetical protein n=1 Tax=Nocardia sp. NPDC005366 TaxID=3156878 RepID=UPI00339F5811
MLPTLLGRLQTRLFALGAVGFLVALLLTPVLPTGSSSTGQAYRATMSVLLATVLVGLLWELLYHFLQQFRWEKDWPTIFGLLTIVNEGLLIWLLLRTTTLIVPAHLRPSATAFAIQFAITWLLFWILVNGPIRVVFHRWRYNGGRFL